MNIILATRNPSKVDQIKEIFRDFPLPVLSLSEAGIDGEATENGETLEDNALKKALYAYERTNTPSWIVADDTGIFINALDGAPGVHSARWAGENATTVEITHHTLKQLEGKEDRSATFRTVVAIVAPDADYQFRDGEIEGTILEAPRAKPQPKMPYSPIFVPKGETLAWAQMSIEYENRISHRGIAFRKACEFIEEQLQK